MIEGITFFDLKTRAIDLYLDKRINTLELEAFIDVLDAVSKMKIKKRKEEKAKDKVIVLK